MKSVHHSSVKPGWRITFGAHRVESTFWALGSAEFKLRAEEALISGVISAIKFLDEKVLLGNGNLLRGGERGGLYSMFLSASAPEKFPFLSATVLLPRCHRQPDGTFVSFTQNFFKLESELYCHYSWGRKELVNNTYGAICSASDVDPPRYMFPEIETDRLIRNKIPDSWLREPSRLGGENLVRAWQLQGEARGFGPKKAQAMIDRAKSRARFPMFYAAVDSLKNIRVERNERKQAESRSQGHSR